MSSCSITEAEDLGHENVSSANASLPNENDEDEDEDVDFNPFLKDTVSLEASSSLSSEIEGLEADVADSGENSCAALTRNPLLKPLCKLQDYAIGDSEHGDEIVMQATVPSGEASQSDVRKNCSPRVSGGKVDQISISKNNIVSKKENRSSGRVDVVDDFVVGESENFAHFGKTVVERNTNDAICMRTRARYSLASFTLDELETFLQETDDDDDLQNVDDEAEYRKFLAAVLQGRESDNSNAQENENAAADYDDDEDNDADFELELEEALESDVDESVKDKTLEKVYNASGWRSRVRKSRNPKTTAHHKKRLSCSLSRPLRPLLPNAPVASSPAFDGKSLMPGKSHVSLPLSKNNGFVCAFTAHQIGQLYCLIHEHVQLLIQVFSLCAAETSRQHIAYEIQSLILEILEKLDQTLAWKRVPYPSFCFYTPHVYPSVSGRVPSILPTQHPHESSLASDNLHGGSLRNNVEPVSNIISPAKGRQEHQRSGQVGDLQITEVSWFPYLTGAIFSVLDVAPLKLVRYYMDDVSAAVRDKKQRNMEFSCDTRFEKEPLFPLHKFDNFAEANAEILSGNVTAPVSSGTFSASVCNEMPKKTLAAVLVEKAKKQSVAPVPKEIANLAQRFIPLFNPALYPHKPPPASVVNRVLFTEAEDELLAMGLMEYNTDWKAIQQRFLPCKSKHQIFVRQKNRSSSKAPENPIKAVRRMKNSPLTVEEKAHIEEGLKIFKLDWMSVWKFIVPYRDPSILPRQWRIATGTQKSYKLDADKKAKRRLYEANRRKRKPVALARHTSSEKEDCSSDNAAGDNNSTDDCMDMEDEAYVHEAFLADWRPGASGPSMRHSMMELGTQEVYTYSFLQEGYNFREQKTIRVPEDSKPQTSHGFSSGLRPVKSTLSLRPYRSRKTNNQRLVKLAPELPPVNLPPSVRVMSQSAFESYIGEASTKTSGSGGADSRFVRERMIQKHRFDTNPSKAGAAYDLVIHGTTTNVFQQSSGIHEGKCPVNEKDGSDLQMHPLLFQTPQDGCLPYFPSTCSGSLGTFNFFPGKQPHLNLSVFHNPHQASHSVNYFFDKSLTSKETTLSSPFCVDFHPLLQHSNHETSPAKATTQISDTMEPSSSKFAQPGNLSGGISVKPHANHGPVTKISSPNGKENEFDLDMHPIFKRGRGEGTRNKDVIEHDTPKSVVSAPVCAIGGTLNGKHSSNCYPEHATTSITPPVSPCNEIKKITFNNKSDQALPEIVMEQEELSDSEEETDENVEFECEEMADSDEERSTIEKMTDMQNKEVPADTKQILMQGASYNGKKCNQTCHGYAADDTVGPSASEGSSAGLDKEKDNSNVFLGMDLNSQDSVSQALKFKDMAFRLKECPASKKEVSTESSRGKNTTSSHSEVVLQTPDLETLDEILVRKPKKRPRRTDLNLSRTKKGDLNSNGSLDAPYNAGGAEAR